MSKMKKQGSTLLHKLKIIISHSPSLTFDCPESNRNLELDDFLTNLRYELKKLPSGNLVLDMWAPTKTKKYGVAIYNWHGDNPYGLHLEIGDTVQILEQCCGWYRGFITKNRSVKGIFPSTYIHLKPCRIENEGSFETAIPLEDSIVREVSLVLRDWSCMWKSLYVERETYKFISLRKVMRELIEWRKQLLTGTLTQDQTRELKLKITAKIDLGNRKLGLDLVPRCGFEMVDPATMSVVELYKVHVQSSENFISARGTLRKPRDTSKIQTRHLFMCMRDFGYHIGEETEVYFSLYDAKNFKFISERFLVKISKEGFSNYVEKLNNNCTIFTELGLQDLSRDLYIIAHVMRIGKMVYSESSKKISSIALVPTPTSYFKRPLGVAVLNISEMLTSNGSEEKEFTFRVFQTDEKDFYQLHDTLIRKQSSKYSPLSSHPNYGIVISLRILDGDLRQIREENPLAFKNVSTTKKMGFSDVIMPGHIRNDLYLTLEKGEFEKGGKSVGKNIEVTIMVLDYEGNIVPNCLWGASGIDPSSEYRSMIIYHHNAPCWMENIRLAVPIEKYNIAHIRFEYRHCSTRDKADNKKLFGISFARLMEPEEATLQDGIHELFIYRCEERTKLHPANYLGLAASVHESATWTSSPEPGSVFTCSHKEIMTVRTMLCSTKLTQNVDLLSLLQWKEHPHRIQDALTRALRLDGEELVKFLQDILDALFSMFSTDDGNSTSHSGLVFHVLVSIFSLLYDSKFEHFKPVMNAYIKEHFAAALVYKGLLSSVQHCAELVMSTDRQEPIQKCFRSLEYIFKFIIQSRILFSRATGGQFEDSFRYDVHRVFASLDKMLCSSFDMILPTQIALLQSSSAVFDQLVQVLPVIEVAKLGVSMLDCLPSRDLPTPLTQAKLGAIKDMIAGKVFKDDEARNLLLITICKHIRYHIGAREEIQLCTDILGEILTFLFHQNRLHDNSKVNICSRRDLEILSLSTLDMLIETCLIVIDRMVSVLANMIACLVSLLQLLDDYHYKRLWEELGDRKPLKDFLLRAFLLFRHLIKHDVFPSDWMVIKMTTNNIILAALQQLAKPLVFCFLETWPHFDYQVWSTYFKLAVAFLTQPALQLETFTNVKRTNIIEKYGDMRVLMGYQILSVWSKLGDHKINFIPSMVGPFLKVTLVPEAELRKATLHIFFDMMECEQRARGNFKEVESELIDKLDYLISENKGDDEYRQLFNTILLERVHQEEQDGSWQETGSVFIHSVTRLLERLLDYRSVMRGDDNRDKRMSCTVNLLNFYKNEFDRKEMYLRYIYKLHDLHISADNFTEAGFTLKLYADQLTWTDGPVLQGDPATSLCQWQRKEQLYHEIVQYFDKGKCWEKGLPLLKELSDFYEKRLFDYTRLSALLKTQAKFCDNILSQLRPEPEYFRVGFYGQGFPLFVRNKVFVYRGLEYERMEAFTQRLQTEFPTAQVLTKNNPPSQTILQSDAQYIQICNVKPVPDIGPPSSDKPLAMVPEKVGRFYEVNDVCTFQLDRPMHKGLVDRDNEFKSLWLERTIFIISERLPGILRWFEVINTATEEVPPVKFACETIDSVNKKLKLLINQYTNEPKRNINPLSMRLQGTIDANVMGGISKYQSAFFSQDFVQNNPQYYSHVSHLSSSIKHQIEIVENGLLIHGQLAPSEVQPLHHRLVERMVQLKQNLRTPPPPESIINSPLPPIPSVDNNFQFRSSEEYTNTVTYFDERRGEYEDIYSKTFDLPNTCAPEIPHRENRLKSEGSLSNNRIKGDQKSNNTWKPGSPKLQRHSMDSSVRNSWPLEDNSPPPLPPRAPERKISDAPPLPRRLSTRRDSEITDIDTAVRDSGYSESLHSASYEEFVLPSIDKDKAAPPPLPPKNIQPQLNSESNELQSSDTYSVPGTMRRMESSP